MGKLLAADAASWDSFGSSVALSGDIALVGAPADDDLGTDSGSAYLFNVNTGAQIAKLQPAEGKAGDRFGRSVALSSSIAVIGSAYNDDNGTDSGSVYVFDTATGVQLATLRPSDGAPGDLFGYSVAVSDSLILVGSYGDDDSGIDSGSAYVFSATTGVQLAKLVDTEGGSGDRLGTSVALSGSIALVGSRFGDASGSVYVFDATGAILRKLRPTDASANQEFGSAISASGSVALIGSRRDDDNGTSSGSAYLYDFVTGSQIRKLKPADGASYDQFAYSVALHGNIALLASRSSTVGSPDAGSAYLFEASTGNQIAKLTAADGSMGDLFGYSLALSGSTALVSIPLDDDLAPDSGSAAVFRLTAGPEVIVFGNGVNIADGDTTATTADHTDFGSVFAGSTISRTFTVRNTGAADLVTSDLEVPPGFTITESLSASIAPGAQDSFTIRLDSLTAGAFTGEIRFSNNDADENPYSFVIHGVVNPVIPDVVVRCDNSTTNIVDGDSTPSTAEGTDIGKFGFGLIIQFSFTVYNVGSATLSTADLVVPPGFGIYEGLSSSIPPGGQDSFTVRFFATTTGVFTGDISFANNDPDENPFNFAIRAEALPPAPEVEVRGNSTLIADNSANPSNESGTNFGNTLVGSPIMRTFTVLNLGTADLTLSDLAVPDGFAILDALNATIPPGGQDTFSVRLDASTPGVFSGDVRFTNNDANENPYNFAIQGWVSALTSEVEVRGNGALIADGLSVASASNHTDFGTRNFAAPITRTFTVRNLGTGVLTTGNLTVPAGFSITEDLLTSIGPGAQDTFSVRLDASSAGSFSGEISFTNNDPDESPYNFAIHGVVLPPTAEVSVSGNGYSISDGNTTPSSQDHTHFGTVGLGWPLTRVFRVYNSGTGILETSGLTVPPGFSITEHLASSILPGSFGTFSVRLDATALGTFAGQISFANNDADENPFNFSISGHVVTPSPEVEVRGNSISIPDGQSVPSVSAHTNFGTNAAGWPLTRIFAVHNVGTDILTIDDLTVPAGFTITEGLSSSLDPGASDTFSVRLDALSPGTFGGEIRFTNNDLDESPFNFTIRGVVIPPTPEIEVRAEGSNSVIVDGDTTPSLDNLTEFLDPRFGVPASRRFIVRNIGTAPLTTSNLTVPEGFSVIEGLSPIIAPGSSDTFTISLNTMTIATHSGEISFLTNDADESPFNFAIRGVVSIVTTRVAKLVDSNGFANDGFGQSVVLSGNTAIVGSYSGASYAGRVHLFNATSGMEIGELSPAGNPHSDGFGYSLAANSTVIIVGAPFDDVNGINSGAVYVFNAANRLQIAKLKPVGVAADDQFGVSVALSGNIALIGSRYDDDNGQNSGSAYLFNVTTGIQIAKLKPSDGAAEDYFGHSVALSGNIAIVGSYGDDDGGNRSGSAYLFDITTGQQVAKLRAADGRIEDRFGYSVALSGGLAIVGAPGNVVGGGAYIFDVHTGEQIAKLQPTDAEPNDGFGTSVALSDNVALVGSPGDDRYNYFSSGSAYLFAASTGNQIAKWVDVATRENFAYFGDSVTLTGSTAVVGAPGSGSSSNGSGIALVFTFDAIAPQVASSTLKSEQSHCFIANFNEPINPLSLALANVTATRLGPMTGVNPTSVTWSANNTVATFTFPTLPDGDYRFTLDAGAVRDVAGNSLASAVTLESPDTFILAGDANRDRRVDFVDLLIVAQNYGQSGKTFSQGNFDYSPDGLVDFSDLLILAQRYGTNLIRVDPRPDVFASRSTRRSPLEPDEPALI